jgi:O-antigen/teichoic acid export membrane protein
MKPVLQVFAFDFTAKILLGVAGLALIKLLAEEEYAVFLWAVVFSQAVVQGVSSNLNSVYIVGYKRLSLDESPERFLALQLWLLTAVIVISLPFVSSFSGVFWIVVALTFTGSLKEFVKTRYQHKLQFLSYSLIEASRAILYVGALVTLFCIEDKQHVKAWQVLSLQTICMLAVVLVAFGKQLDVRCLLKLNETIPIAKSILKSKFSLMIGYCFVLAYLTRLDIFMLKSLDSDIEMSTYGSAFMYYGLVMILLAAMHTVYLPLTQRVNDRRQLGSLMMKHQRMIYVAVPLVIIGAWLSQWIIPFIDAGKYPGACEVFRILAISAIISLACSPHAHVLFRYDAYRFLFIVVCGAFVVNVGLNAVMIPRFHASGAAWATLVSMGIVNGSTYLKSRSLLASAPLPQNSSAAVAAG